MNEGDRIIRDCLQCNLCVRECLFLEKYGNPARIVNAVQSGDLDETMAFECSLCALCTAVCPVDIDPCDVFLAMRTSVSGSGGQALPCHKNILAYEKRGRSRMFSLYNMPDGCSTVFFPGCAFTGTRPVRTQQIYSWLQQEIADLGIVFDCCTKPSHDLGRIDFFRENFYSMEKFMVRNGIKNIITVCPNCYEVFCTYSKNLITISVYEIMAEKEITADVLISGCVTIHDPCVARFESSVQNSVRDLVKNKGLEIREMNHSREKTICCGEGGSVSHVAPDIASRWRNIRKNEAENNTIITYCAGCCSSLEKHGRTAHVLDLVFEPEKTLDGSLKTYRPPFTYLARLNLKKRLKKEYSSSQYSGRTDLRKILKRIRTSKYFLPRSSQH